MNKIVPQTLQIQAKGAARLSEDLVLSKYFRYAIDKRKKIVTFQPADSPNGSSVRVWQTKRGRTGYMAMAKVLRQFGLAWEELEGKTYKVKRRGGSLEVKLG